MIEIKQVGTAFEAIAEFRKAVEKLEREGRKEIAKAWRKQLQVAVTYGRGLITALFHGRGKSIKRAFRQTVRITPDDVVGRIGYKRAKGSKGFLGRFYETGVTIRPKGSGFLWVPVGDNRDAAGNAIISPRQFFDTLQGRSVVKRSARGNMVAFRSDEGELKPMFVLKDHVNIPQRPVLASIKSKFLPLIVDETGQQVYSFFKGAKI